MNDTDRLWLETLNKRHVLHNLLPDSFPKIITLCGSTRFKEDYERMNALLSLKGYVVFSVSRFGHRMEVPLPEEQKIVLDHVHFRKIDLSHGILVINKDQYIGSSTSNEIRYTLANHKIVDFMERPNETTCERFGLAPYCVNHNYFLNRVF